MLHANGFGMKDLYFILVLIVISGCSSRAITNQAVDQVIENVTNADISYKGFACPDVKRKCASGNYEKWYQENGKLACACNR